jgi:N utilization substance protein B
MDTPHSHTPSRELALQALYALEIIKEGDIEGTIKSIAEIMELDTDCRPYAHHLAEQTLLEQTRIDELIQKHAANWELKRMAATDRNVLRLGVAELLVGEVPFRVVIDEAVELAKSFGTDDSGKFVNGILDTIRKEICPHTDEPEPTAPAPIGEAVAADIPTKEVE